MQDAQGWTALLAACEYGHQECAELLVDSGADIHVADQHGCSPLMAAAAHNHAEIVRPCTRTLMIQPGPEVYGER